MTSIEMLPPTKRDRLKKQAKLEVKKKLREALPILTRNEIRRVRLPYHEALLLELEEDGYTSSAEFLKQLIQYQEDMRREHGPDSVVSSRPRLLDCRKELDRLYSGLKTAEGAHYIDNIGAECDELIKLGVMFALGLQDWWWLGEQLLIQAVNVSSSFQKDGGRREAINRYIFGKFILENLLDPDRAKEELIAARQLSTGKPWTAKKEIGYKQDTVLIESCILLYKALLAEAKEVMKYDPLKAARICAIARKRANDACDRHGEAEALMIQGLCEMEAGDASAAVESFLKVLIFHTKAGRLNGICEARIHIALAFLKIGKFSDTLSHLEALLKFAEENNLHYYVAQALRFLGEYYLNQGMPNIATPLLIKALNIFHEIEDLLNREQARNLAAISAGQELIQKYTELILKCGKEGLKGHAHVLKLVRWKDIRELFWTEGEESSSGSRSVESFEQSLTTLSEQQFLNWEPDDGEYEEVGEEFATELEMIKEVTSDDELDY
ncbi:hypothetical protein ILUMI_23525 [Ignelater luminosus]|uniref:Tetratricopeptide repeat protein 29 n=1 Tax=Ignelater luminosus TaxID=2038154 RepID=A0A8K0G1J9_IGNLU|nr:hypothetical protein ILUMI_23525 [Ignelater luminosus]